MTSENGVLTSDEHAEAYARAVEWGRRRGHEEMMRFVVGWLLKDARRRVDVRRAIPMAVRRLVNAIPWGECR